MTALLLIAALLATLLALLPAPHPTGPRGREQEFPLRDFAIFEIGYNRCKGFDHLTRSTRFFVQAWMMACYRSIQRVGEKVLKPYKVPLFSISQFANTVLFGRELLHS